MSIERDSDPLLFTPDDTTRPMNVFGQNDKVEPLRNADGTDNLEGSSARGKVANSAIDRTAAELDGSGLQHAMTRRNAMLVSGDHAATLAQKPFRSLTSVAKA